MVARFAEAPMVALGSMAAADAGAGPTKDLPKNLPHTLELSGGILILARVVPSEEENFAQVLLPVALSHETFMCKLCVALGVEREAVKKVLKLPDILIRSTEDVVRLENWDKLELRLKRKSALRSVATKVRDVGRSTGPALAALLLLLYLALLWASQLSLRHDLAALASQLSSARHDLHSLASALNFSAAPSGQGLLLGSPAPPSDQLLEALSQALQDLVSPRLDDFEKALLRMGARVKNSEAILKETKTCAPPTTRR